MLLKIVSLTSYYGEIPALRGVSLEVGPGEWVSVVGANGAGKSTLLKSIVGSVPRKTGSIIFQGEEIGAMDTIGVVRRGITLVPEGRELFGSVSVKDNLTLGAYLRYTARGGKKEIERDFDRVYSLFPVLSQRKNQLAETLSGGEQQMLAVGRALMAQPKLLLLDELSLGLAPVLVQEIYKTITKLNQQGLSLLLVEQNALIAFTVARRAYILETGRVVMAGAGRELMESPEVRETYFGSRTLRDLRSEP